MWKKISSAILSFFFLISFSSFAGAAVTLTVENGVGYLGSNESRVDISLDNPDDSVDAIAIDICDTGNFISCTGCETMGTGAIPCAVCANAEQTNGCCRVIWYNIAAYPILPGSGPVATVKYSVLEQAPVTDCRDLNLENIQVANEFNVPVDVIPVPGEICFQSCTSDEDCIDSSFCNGKETCNRDTGICVDGTNPCQSPTENFCEEFTEQCIPEPTTPITLFVGSNAALPGSQSTIDLILYNNIPDNAVTGIELDIYDIDNYLVCSEFMPDCDGDFNFSSIELLNGCCRLTVSPKRPNSIILPGTEYLGSVFYNVSESAPLGETRNLNIQNVRVLDENNNELPVTLYPGEFCFSSDPENDGVSDCEDNCPSMFNPDQADTDGDGIGNVCENMSAAIPTLSEWGAIIFMTILVGTGVVFILRRMKPGSHLNY